VGGKESWRVGKTGSEFMRVTEGNCCSFSGAGIIKEGGSSPRKERGSIEG